MEVFIVNRLILLVSLLLLSPYLCGQDNQLRSIRFATYNVRRKGPEKKKHRSWSKRRKPVLELTKNGLQADIIGFQEPIKSQIKDLAGGLETIKSNVTPCGSDSNRSEVISVTFETLLCSMFFCAKYNACGEMSLAYTVACGK